ncbi:hypothetical protein C0993_011465 [Termitomyces sp. T159_Od127]|nr:hypothetical protein C0993_011465 [Termitomyces sp. T159_Od127]
MATYTHTYQPTSYQTNAYKRHVPDNYYAMSTPQLLYPAPSIEHYPTLVPRYWAPDQNQVPYSPSISQGIPQNWQCNLFQATAGTHQWVLPRGMLETLLGARALLALAHTSSAFFALDQYYAQLASALPPPLQDYSDTCYLPWPRTPAAPPIHTPPSPLDHQRVEAYIQLHDEVLCSLHISPAEFAKHACTLLISLGHYNLFGTLEQRANCLFEFHELYQCGAISESAQNTLQVDLNLWDELHTLVDKIYTSSTFWHFKNSMDPARLFHVQCKKPIEPWDPVPALVPCQQEELKAASNILKALNPTGGLPTLLVSQRVLM